MDLRSDIKLLSKPLAADETAFSEEWYDTTSDTHFWMRWRFQIFEDQLAELGIPLTTETLALEVGSGRGVLRSQIEGAGNWIVDISDINLQALNSSRPGRGKVLHYNIRDQCSEMADKYQVLILFDVLEHIEDYHQFLDSVIWHLRPGAWLFINVPALQWCYSNYDRAVGHVRRYNMLQLADQLASFPVTIRNSRYWGFTLVPVLMLRKLLFLGQSNLTARDDEEIVQRGMMPRFKPIDWGLRAMMTAELSTIGKPPLGTSIMCACQRT